jgi:hypothetical protein
LTLRHPKKPTSVGFFVSGLKDRGCAMTLAVSQNTGHSVFLADI